MLSHDQETRYRMIEYNSQLKGKLIIQGNHLDNWPHIHISQVIQIIQQVFNIIQVTIGHWNVN